MPGLYINNTFYNIESIEYEMMYHKKRKLSRLVRWNRNRQFLKNHPSGMRFLLHDDDDMNIDNHNAEVFMSLLKSSDPNTRENYIYNTADLDRLEFEFKNYKQSTR